MVTKASWYNSNLVDINILMNAESYQKYIMLSWFYQKLTDNYLNLPHLSKYTEGLPISYTFHQVNKHCYCMEGVGNTLRGQGPQSELG